MWCGIEKLEQWPVQQYERGRISQLFRRRIAGIVFRFDPSVFYLERLNVASED
jgi:hypothetical protein